MRIQIEVQIDDENKEVWGFNLFDLNLVFVTWHLEFKPKGKRKWEIVKYWDKYGRYTSQMVIEPMLTQHIKEKALLQVIEMIKVKTWDEWN